MTKVLLDLLFFTGARGGMESYVRQLYPEISKLRPDWELVALISDEVDQQLFSWFPGELISISSRNGSAINWAIGETFQVGLISKKFAVDLIHCPANIGPIWGKTPVILTIQDLLSFENPKFVGRLTGFFLRQLIRLSARHAKSILTISHSSKRSIEKHLPKIMGTIHVAELAGGNRQHQTTQLSVEKTDSKVQILSGGNRLPHKNFKTLLESLSLIDESQRPFLTITGGPADDPLLPIVEDLGLENFVSLKGWVPQEQIEELYRDSKLYVFPTRFEGFGLPVLEAMARECPVICSDISVLREVGGEAAIYVDTTQPAKLATAIIETLQNKQLLKNLVENGKDRANEFTWRKTAIKTVEAIEQLLPNLESH
jgi:glycosyltransferase involved in cell wall biosynthesis